MNIKRVFCCILALVSTLTLFSSCTKNVTTQKNGAESELLESIDSEDEGNLGALGNTVNPYEGVLGYGYDVVTKAYFNESDISAKSLILDIDKLAKDDYVYRQSRVAQNSVVTAGESMKSFQQDVAQNISASFTYGLFSKVKGEFSLSNHENSSSNSTNIYIKDKARIIREREYIDMSDMETEDLLAYVKPKFLKALNKDVSTKPFAEQKAYYFTLFQQYGTHVLMDVLLGGRIDMNYVYKNTQSKSISDIKADVNLVYTSFSAKGRAELSEEQKKTVQSFTENSSLISSRYGGTVEGGIQTVADMSAVFDNWTKSFTSRDTYEFIDIGDGFSTSLLGIWELAEDTAIRDTIYSMYCLYLGEAGSYFSDFDDKSHNVQYVKAPYIGQASDIKEAMSTAESTISHTEPNSSYYILPYNINVGIKNKPYSYLTYTYTMKKEEAIRDIRFINFSNTDTIPDTVTLNTHTYKKLNYNFNTYGNSRKYLYYTTDEGAGTPLKDISVESNFGYAFGNTAAGWTSVLTGMYSSDSTKLSKDTNWVKQTTNAGSGADRNLYFWFKR